MGHSRSASARQLEQGKTHALMGRMVYFKAKNDEHILYRVGGEGSTFVLLHPLGISSRYFDGLTSTLITRGHRVVRFDLPGHGGSSLGRLDQTLETCLDVVVEVLQRTVTDSCGVIACGFGAYLATSAIVQGHTKPTALIVANPTLGPSTWLQQGQQFISRVAADKLTMRTTETVNPFPVVDIFESRQNMCRSVRTMEQYEKLLARLDPITLDAVTSLVPTSALSISRAHAPDEPILEVLNQLQCTNVRDR